MARTTSSSAATAIDSRSQACCQFFRFAAGDGTFEILLF